MERYVSVRLRGKNRGGHPPYLEFSSPNLISNFLTKTFTHTSIASHPANVRITPRGLTIPIFPREQKYLRILKFPSIAYGRSLASGSPRACDSFGRVRRIINRLSETLIYQVMTTEQIRDYLEKQLFLENTVVRELESSENTHRRTLGYCSTQVTYRLLSREFGIHVSDARLYAGSMALLR